MIAPLRGAARETQRGARAREQAVALLHRAGLTDAQIADRLGLSSAGSIGNIRGRLGLLVRPSPRRFSRDERDALDDRVAALTAAGRTDAAIAAELSVSETFVETSRERRGLFRARRRPAAADQRSYERALQQSGGWFCDDAGAAARSASAAPLPDFMCPWYRRDVPCGNSSLA